MDDFKIGYSISERGFSVRINSERFYIRYPEKIWKSFPKKIRKTIVENFVFLSTSTLPAFVGRKKVFYNMNSPLLSSFFLKPILYYVPSCADEYNADSFTLVKRLMNTDYNFKSYNIRIQEYNPLVRKRAITLFTFGKDSLLSYAIAEEIGMEPIPIYIEEPDISYRDKKTKRVLKTYENKHKNSLIKRFSSEFKKPIYKIKHQLSLVKEAKYLGITEAEIPWGSQLTEYALLCIPFNHHFKARYIIYGNEASCSTTYINSHGLKANPVFDQSSEWTIEISKLMKLLTKKMSALSLVEPLHEIAITKILHSRYPHYAKYQMSCFADHENAKNSRWCHNCSKCARIYAFLVANNIAPESVGFRENMFKKEKMRFFSIFGQPENALPYDLAGTGRDELMLAFFMACENKSKGYLIDLFMKKYYSQIKKRSPELKREFFGIHDSLTLSSRLKDKVKDIYKKALIGETKN